jgi:hypothetical protein
MKTRYPASWRYRLFCAGLFAAGAGWLAITTDLILSAVYGWHTSILIAALNGDTVTQTLLLWWACFVLIALHARD